MHSASLGHGEGLGDEGGEDGAEAAQLLVVVETVLFVLGAWLATDVLATDVLDNVSDVVVLVLGELATLSNDHFVATLTEVLLVVNQEVPTLLQPQLHLCSEAVIRNAYLAD